MERQGLGRDAIAAGVLALVLGAGWALHDWAALRVLRLPDTDDVMRLQQVRDWLAGQRFADLVQHRLAAGLPMHWTRVADLAPAALIVAGTPLLGAHGAEVAAVIVWPIALFAVAILLVSRIARAVGGAAVAGAASVVAAIGYPATAVFMPGRIDHHGLQMVLLLGATLALAGRASVRGGVVTGMLAATSLVIGLETAPMLAAVAVVAVIDWIRGDDRGRLAGVGAGALAGLVIGRLVFAPEAWGVAACDGFTGEAWTAEMVLASAPIALFASGRWKRTWQARLVAAGISGGMATAAALWLSPGCLHPYGAVDPLLAQLWLARVGEAQPLFAAPAATAFGYAGMTVVGTAATAWRLRVTGEREWAVLLVLLAAALAVTLVQLRGAYAGALLAAPGLAATVVAARGRGVGALAGAWIASAGMLYPIAAAAMVPVATPARGSKGTCTSAALVNSLAHLPTGTVMAPIDVGAWAIAATPHRLIAAPYHRNNAGNRSMFTFFLGDPTAARSIARHWRVDYVALCDGDFDAYSPAASTLAARLRADAPPPWLLPLPSETAGLRLFAVRR